VAVGTGKTQSKVPSGGMLAGLLQTLPEAFFLWWAWAKHSQAQITFSSNRQYTELMQLL